MAGYYETQVRRALMTVGDPDVLNEMATGWRASIRDLNTVDDRLNRGINGLRDHDQLGDRTRDAAIGAFRDMRAYVAEQRLLLGKTAQALDAAGGALTQVTSLIRAWDRQGEPTPPGPAPVPDPAATDQTAYWQAAGAHQRASTDYGLQLQQREDEARGAWDSLNRVFGIAEDKIRTAHGMPLEEERTTTEPVYPPVGWPGPKPENPEPGWPQLPPWPPSHEKPKPGPGPGPGTGPAPGPGLPPGPGAGPHPGPGNGPAYPQPGGSGHPGHHSHGPTTTVSGAAQSGVAYAPSTTGSPSAGSFAAPSAGSFAGTPLSTAGLTGVAAGGSAAMEMRGGAGPASGGSAAGAGRTAGAGAAGSAGRSGRSGLGAQGRNAGGAKGSQQASGQAKAGRGGAGGAGSRGGRRKDRSVPTRTDLLDTADQWLDGEGTAPDVLR